MVENINYDYFRSCQFRLTHFFICFKDDSDSNNINILKFMELRCRKYKCIECYSIEFEEYFEKKRGAVIENKYSVMLFERSKEVRIFHKINKEELNHHLNRINKLCFTNNTYNVGLIKTRQEKEKRFNKKYFKPSLTAKDEYITPESDPEESLETPMMSFRHRQSDYSENLYQQSYAQGRMAVFPPDILNQTNWPVGLQTQPNLPHSYAQTPYLQLQTFQHSMCHQQQALYHQPYLLLQRVEHQTSHLPQSQIQTKNVSQYPYASNTQHTQQFLSSTHSTSSLKKLRVISRKRSPPHRHAKLLFDVPNQQRSPARSYTHSVEEIMGLTSSTEQTPRSLLHSSSHSAFSTHTSARSDTAGSSSPRTIKQSSEALQPSLTPLILQQSNEFRGRSKHTGSTSSVDSLGKVKSTKHSSTTHSQTPYHRPATHSGRQTPPTGSNTGRITPHIYHPQLIIQSHTQTRPSGDNTNISRTPLLNILVNPRQGPVPTQRKLSPRRQTSPYRYPHHPHPY